MVGAPPKSIGVVNTVNARALWRAQDNNRLVVCTINFRLSHFFKSEQVE